MSKFIPATYDGSVEVISSLEFIAQGDNWDIIS